jgi:hypothetical protein
MSDPVSPVKSAGPNAQETLGFRSIVPLGVVELVNLIRDRSIHLQPDPGKYRLPPVNEKNDDCDHSNKRTLDITAIAMDKTRKNKNVLNELVQLGFVDLAEKLKDKSGPPWDDILQIDNPLIIEQLYDLATLLEIKKSAGIECNSSHLIKAGLQFGRDAATAPSALLGKLIYLLDSDPHRLNRHAREQEKELLAWIEKRFSQCIEEVKTGLHCYQKKHLTAGIQDGDLAYQNQLPIEIANFTLSSTGFFNIGLVEEMIEAFTDKANSTHSYPSHLVHSLNQLAANPSLREKLSRILKPSSEEAPANVVIRTTLDLSPTHRITDLEAKKTALTALLTFLRQGSDGSCFATPLVISLLNHRLDKCLDDFAQLLKCSKLTRQVGQESYDFPFILRIGDQSLLKSIRVTRTGKFVLPNGKLIRLSKVPGVIAVMKALGLEKVKVRMLFQHCKKDELFVEISIKQMLQALVRQARDLPFNKSKSLADLYLHGCFAFAAQECNPLTEMWENAIAGMAEADGQSMVRSAIIASLTKVLGNAINKKFENDLEFGTLLSKHLITLFNQKIHLQWDPHITYSDLSADQYSTEGAFVLYDKGSYSKPSRWLRVDNPKSFQAFVLRVLDEAKKGVKRSDVKVNWAANRDGFQKFELYIESLQFLKDAINDYYPLNAENEHPLKNFQELAYAPWVTKSGNSLNKVIQIYLENPGLKPFNQLVPKNAEELLSQLISLARSLPKDLKQKLISQPNYCLPVRIPYLHAFSIIPGHPTFRSSWTEEIPPADWINAKLIAPGQAISESILPSVSRQQIISSIGNTFIHIQNISEFNKAVQDLPEMISITKFRQALLEIIIKLESDETLLPHLIASFLDGSIYQSLPENLKDQLTQSAIHIADSNWARGKHGINFCLVVNPGTGKIEMWVANDEQSHLFPLDQTTWFNHGGWEFFNI